MLQFATTFFSWVTTTKKLEKRLDILSLIWDADDLVFSLFSPDSAISVTRKSQSKSS